MFTGEQRKVEKQFLSEQLPEHAHEGTGFKISTYQTPYKVMSLHHEYDG